MPIKDNNNLKLNNPFLNTLSLWFIQIKIINSIIIKGNWKIETNLAIIKTKISEINKPETKHNKYTL